KRTLVQFCPGVQGRLHHENFEWERGAPVGGDHVGEFASGFVMPLRAIAFEEVVLIDVAVGGRVALDEAYSIVSRHGRIIGGAAGEVNAGICLGGWSRYETALFPSGSKSERICTEMHRVDQLRSVAGTQCLLLEIRQGADSKRFLRCA